MSADLFAIEADPTLTPYARLLLAIFQNLRDTFAEVGAPLTSDQEAILAGAEDSLRRVPA